MGGPDRVEERRETDEAMTRRLVKERLTKAGQFEETLSETSKGHSVKAAVARQGWRETPGTGVWIVN
jgi:hypothetical protein